MLRYLFKAEFTDGTFIQQTQEDVSLLQKGKNRFYDVLNSEKKLKRITYYEQKKIWNPTVVSVDYETGAITVNGVELLPEKEANDKLPVRHMLVSKHFNATYNKKSGKLISTRDLDEERIFFIGWETKDKKTRHVIGVK